MTAGDPRVVLFTRPGCHLCDDARVVVEAVTSELGHRFVECDITANPGDPAEAARYAAYKEAIPVVTVDGVQVDFWRISADRLRAALGA
jgi:glutaredoxin